MASHNGMDLSGATYGFPSSLPGPAMPGMNMNIGANSNAGTFPRHGSAELPAGARGVGPLTSYLDSMGGATPVHTPPRSPRSTRARSSDPDDFHEERRRERADRRRERDHDEPVGVNFRLTACEQTLQQHYAEITAQRAQLAELADEMKKQISNHGIHGQRLDAVFGLVDEHFGKLKTLVILLLKTSAPKPISSLTL